MITRINIFLLWLLALTIPVQSFAAVTQLACAPSHQMQMAMNIDMDMHAGMQHADAAMPSMAHMAYSADQSSLHDQQQQQQHHSDPQHHQTSSCSSCTVCTIGAILPLALAPLLHLPLPAEIHIALIEQGFVGYTPENPERPPSLPA